MPRNLRKKFLHPLLLVMLSPLFAILFALEAHSYDIRATNQAVGTLSGGSTAVTFDLTWARSWRSATVINNWDAAWVFVKFRTTTGGTLGDWKHASLNNTGHSVPSGATLTTGLVDTGSAFDIATNPVVGVFIYRSADGDGTFTPSGVSLSWNYSQDGVTASDTVDIQVFAIEMVYIPDGAFFAGDNKTSAKSFRQELYDNDPWYVGSEDAITVSSGAGSGYGSGASPDTGTGVGERDAEYYDPFASGYTLPAAFPKGYRKFYMMKGEISQGQWVAFFNTLTSSQRSARDITANSGKNTDGLNHRNNVSWSGSSDATLPDRGGGATYAGVAMNWLSWADVAAYLDWAGLRPMSELEYERAGRGPYRAVSGEYAWGSTSITGATSITDGGLQTEGPGNAANCVYGNETNVNGPMRVGCMAYGDKTRIPGGFGYFGNVDLSGNLWERCVTVSNSSGRSFEGRYHGNGALATSGAHDATSWPGTDAVGTGFRGGRWSYGSGHARLSHREHAATAITIRWDAYGGRGVRSAP